MKLYLKQLAIVLCNFIFFACDKDDNGSTSNQDPTAFNLITVIDGELDLEVIPTFSWEAATDPDGDAVTYSLLIDTNSNPTVEIAAGINDTTFTLTQRLALAETLFWKVIATDANGATTESETFTLTTRNLNTEGTQVNANAAFSGRESHTSVVFDGKLWVIGPNNVIA